MPSAALKTHAPAALVSFPAAVVTEEVLKSQEFGATQPRGASLIIVLEYS